MADGCMYAEWLPHAGGKRATEACAFFQQGSLFLLHCTQGMVHVQTMFFFYTKYWNIRKFWILFRVFFFFLSFSSPLTNILDCSAVAAVAVQSCCVGGLMITQSYLRWEWSTSGQGCFGLPCKPLGLKIISTGWKFS